MEGISRIAFYVQVEVITTRGIFASTSYREFPRTTKFRPVCIQRVDAEILQECVLACVIPSCTEVVTHRQPLVGVKGFLVGSTNIAHQIGREALTGFAGALKWHDEAREDFSELMIQATRVVSIPRTILQI